jgi:hypothetical protein
VSLLLPLVNPPPIVGWAAGDEAELGLPDRGLEEPGVDAGNPVDAPLVELAGEVELWVGVVLEVAIFEASWVAAALSACVVPVLAEAVVVDVVVAGVVCAAPPWDVFAVGALAGALEADFADTADEESVVALACAAPFWVTFVAVAGLAAGGLAAPFEAALPIPGEKCAGSAQRIPLTSIRQTTSFTSEIWVGRSVKCAGRTIG